MLSPELASSLRDSLAFFVHLGVTLVPLFLVGSFLVGLAQEYVPPERVERALRGHDEGLGNVAAAGFGAVTPFCSCSTVPLLAGLLQAGAPLGLSVSFLLASPLVNEIAVVFLFGLFGLEVTVAYVAVTFTAAVLGGILVGRLGMADHVKDVQLGGGRAVATDGGTVDGCAAAPVDDRAPTHREHFATAAREAASFFRDTLPYLLLGMTVGALIHGVVPVAVLQAVLGPQNPLAVPLAAAAGAPIYVSLSGTVPIAASLLEGGIAVGTVVAFVIGGAGMSVPNLVLLNKLFDRRLLAVYAVTVAAIATTTGVLFNLLLA